MLSATLLRKKRTIFTLLLFLFLVFLYFWTKPTFSETGTIKIVDRNNTLLYESAGSLGKKIPVTYDKLPPYVINAAIASEDESFWTNPGIDLKAIIRSILSNSKEGRIVSGASTITQQLARAAII